MKTTLRGVGLLVTTLGLAGVANGAEPDAVLTTSVRAAVEENLRGYNAEDADAALRSVHTRSPEYEPTKAAMADQFRDLDIKAELIDFRYMGHDDEFVVARVKTRLVGPAGSGFNDNLVDSIVLFHQEGGVWKLWSDDILGVKLSAK